MTYEHPGLPQDGLKKAKSVRPWLLTPPGHQWVPKRGPKTVLAIGSFT